jgi:ribonuclease HI
MLILVQSLIRSKLQYGQEAFFAAPAYLLKKLQQIETLALKLVFDTPKYAINTLIYQEAGWLPLDKERTLRCATYQVRANSVPNSTKHELTKDFDNNDKLVRRSLKNKTPTIHAKTTPFYEYTKTLFKDSGADIEADLSDAVPEILPSWLINFPTTDLSLGNCSSKKDDPNTLAALTKELISEKYSGYLKVFTDGSKGKNGSAGCGFVIPELGIEHSYKLNDHVSVYTSEMFAIYMASQKILSLHPSPQKVAIFSDSLSSLQSLENLKGQRDELLHDIINTHDLIIDQGSVLCLVWIPSHIGIRGNDMADSAAKRGASLTDHSANLGLSSSEMCSLLKQTAVNKHIQDLKNITTENGWLFSDPKSGLPSMPYHMQSVLFRIRTVSTISKFFPTLCTCSRTINLQHIFDECADMSNHFGSLHTTKKALNLPIEAFLGFHPEHGWNLTKMLCTAIIKSPFGILF